MPTTFKGWTLFKINQTTWLGVKGDERLYAQKEWQLKLKVSHAEGFRK